jgi:hypothetical protein
MFKLSTVPTAIIVAAMVVPACSSSGLKANAHDAGAASGGEAGSTTSSGTTGGAGGPIGPGGSNGGDGTDGSTGEMCGCLDAQGNHLPAFDCPCPVGPPACPAPTFPCEAGYQGNPHRPGGSAWRSLLSEGHCHETQGARGGRKWRHRFTPISKVRGEYARELPCQLVERTKMAQRSLTRFGTEQRPSWVAEWRLGDGHLPRELSRRADGSQFSLPMIYQWTPYLHDAYAPHSLRRKQWLHPTSAC